MDVTTTHITRPPFQPFGTFHLVSLALILTALVAVYLLRDTLTGERVQTRVRYVLGACILCSEISFYVANLLEHNRGIDLFLPLHLCGAVLYFIFYFTVRPNRTGFEIIYFWAFLGGTLACLMPDMRGHNFPDYLALQMLFSHGLLLVYALFMVLAYSKTYPLTSKSVLRVFGITCVLAVLAALANATWGTNYMFLGGSPPGQTTPLDYLSTGFWKIPEMAAIFLTLLYGMYGIWKLTAGRAKESTADYPPQLSS